MVNLEQLVKALRCEPERCRECAYYNTKTRDCDKWRMRLDAADELEAVLRARRFVENIPIHGSAVDGAEFVYADTDSVKYTNERK